MKQSIEFATVTKGAEVQKVGRSAIYQQKSHYDGRTTNWFDDSKLIKSKRKE